MLIDSPHRKGNTTHVLLYIPNIIDRCAAALCYVVSFALDELDGNLARYFVQTSEFGMLLDILIDEASVTALCHVLATLYPVYTLAFQMFSILDFCGQWSIYHFAARFRNNDYKHQDNWLTKIYFNSYMCPTCSGCTEITCSCCPSTWVMVTPDPQSP
ncbi:hypothetical protein DPMN_153564 [Dreissena polymorpha]|uniref:CDP-diacylglycerol--inositol 3-phosphatidyltransferase n=1 Tax=Dreissena polymorpha TaxID=45954 RepID=A0A9D4J665_DREPO|nr:hypothetical protein DPMN_153564 [Dreissena polymorpha]